MVGRGPCITDTENVKHVKEVIRKMTRSMPRVGKWFRSRLGGRGGARSASKHRRAGKGRGGRSNTCSYSSLMQRASARTHSEDPSMAPEIRKLMHLCLPGVGVLLHYQEAIAMGSEMLVCIVFFDVCGSLGTPALNAPSQFLIGILMVLG